MEMAAGISTWKFREYYAKIQKFFIFLFSHSALNCTYFACRYIYTHNTFLVSPTFFFFYSRPFFFPALLLVVWPAAGAQATQQRVKVHWLNKKERSLDLTGWTLSGRAAAYTRKERHDHQLTRTLIRDRHTQLLCCWPGQMRQNKQN